MNTLVSAVLGVTFIVVGTASVFLMFYLWGFPFDKARRKSAAPRSLMLLHRGLGYVFVAIYLFMMWQMVPRMIHYQVEFPPRTVAHMMLAITIGFLLLIKVAIVRFFRHLEEWMPYLGVGILLCAYLMLGLSIPFAMRDRMLSRGAAGGSYMSRENLERVKKLLPTAGLPKDVATDDLATPKGLTSGRETLMTKCVQCHDLKTVLTRPRTPRDWVQTVERMADKPVFGDLIKEEDQWKVAAYLIAITPELQHSAKRARTKAAEAKDDRVAAVVAMEGSEVDSGFDAAKVKPLVEEKCSECHELDELSNHEWTGNADVKEILERMVDNGMEATPEELESVRRYLLVTYPQKPPSPKDVPPPPSAAAVPAVDSAPDPLKPIRKPKGPKAADAAPAAPTPVAPEGSDNAPTCGKKPLPDCPLQGFMKSKAALASSSEDGPALAAVFDRITKMAPPGYRAWSGIASDGATAARAGDFTAARQACSTCHTQFRAKYRAEMRARPIP